MKQYCKAFYLADLRRFPGWSEPAHDGATGLADDTVVYLWDDLTVVANPVRPEDGALFEAVDAEWERFCRQELRFEIPEDLIDD